MAEIWVLAGLFMGQQIGLTFPTQSQCLDRLKAYAAQAEKLRDDPVERRAAVMTLTCVRFTQAGNDP